MLRSRIARIVQPILIVFLLVGCTNTEPVQVNHVPPRAPDMALEECPKDLPKAEGPTRQQILEARSATAKQMVECAEKHRTLRNYIQDIISIPGP